MEILDYLSYANDSLGRKIFPRGEVKKDPKSRNEGDILSSREELDASTSFLE